MQEQIEKCIWIDWQKKIPADINVKRIYFGHETCERLLPNTKEISHIVDLSKQKNIHLTFVTPFLSETGIHQVTTFLSELRGEIENFEVVVSDWGLLDWLCNEKIGIPVISRFLVGQQVDFRLAALCSDKLADDKIIVIDNKLYRLKQRILSDELKEHLMSCSLLNQTVVEYFIKHEVFRFELSNVFQNIRLNNDIRIVYSLHVPLVPLTIMRWCPNENEDFNSTNSNCVKQNCHSIIKWHNLNDNVAVFHINNSVYYLNNVWESKILANQNIDRIVFNNADIQ